MTNDRTTQCGIYEITIKQMCYDTGYNEDTIKKLIEFFTKCGKIQYSLATKEIAMISWVGFLYAALFSQWIGFFAWYKGLDLGGAVRVSQIQLLMPFLTFIFSIILLKEILDFFTIFFSITVIVIIYISKKTNVMRENN